MRRDKELAFELRKQGKSYNDISKQLYIPKSTLSDWFSTLDWSNGIKKSLNILTRPIHTERVRNLAHDRGQKLKEIYKKAEDEACQEFGHLKNNPLFVASLMLYWGEGDKANKNRCCLSNTDPNMLRLYVLFLEKICGVEKSKIKAWILVYPDTDKIKALEFWSKSINIWPTNFTKPVTIEGKSATRRLPFGVCYVTVASSYLKRKLEKWMVLLSQELINKY